MSGNQQQAPPAEGATPVSPAGAKFCANCGKPLAAGAKFCSECGAKVGG
jgi:membrane protease subunit (stomatin/prohibitin family)